jgi:hypothetical protein
MNEYRKWLKLQIEFLRGHSEWANPDDDLPAILDEARQRAVDLGLVDALACFDNESLLAGCVGALASLPKTSVEKAAEYLDVSTKRSPDLLNLETLNVNLSVVGSSSHNNTWTTIYLKIHLTFHEPSIFHKMSVT